MKPKVICFDADDTLWRNEEYYRAAEQTFCDLLTMYAPPTLSKKVLYDTEIRNLDLLGYGSKAFTISMVEAALEITQDRLPTSILKDLIALGKENIAPPMELLPQVIETLEVLAPHYRLALATKGDLRDQERKLHRSGLRPYFNHISIVSEKNRYCYQKILDECSLSPLEFMMVGNSFKSDILPVLELGAQAVYIPSAVLWIHEEVEPIEHPLLHTIEHIGALTKILL